MDWKPPCVKQWSCVLDNGLDVMLCLRTERITKYFDGLLEMLLIERKNEKSRVPQYISLTIIRTVDYF
jgi:hypothetical protein